ncbi:MAG TPA: hypothetical protein EYG38_15980, partial [Verrucomicrobia bacterium]|nr:hypothetical protein [Verrucomicrobiota bacterium]
GGGDWSDANNWTPGGGPPNGNKDKATFADMTGSGGISVTMDSSHKIDTITFSSNGNNYTIGSSSDKLELYKNFNSTGSTDTSFGAGIQLNGDSTFTVSGAGVLSISGVIEGGKKLKKKGAGTLILSGVNEFSKDLEVHAGTVLFGNNTAAGSKKIKMKGGNIGATGSDRTISLNVDVDNSFSVNGDANLTLSGQINLKAASKTITVSSGLTTTISGKIKKNGGASDALVKEGAGTLLLSNAGNQYQAGTTVNAGTLQVNNNTVLGPGDGSDYLGAGSLTLGSGGTVEINGNLTLEGSSLIGNGGTLQVSGDLTYDSTTLTSSPNITLTPAAGTTSTISISSAATSISGVGEFTVNGGSSVSTVQLDNNLSATGLTITEGDLSMAGNVTVSGDVTLTGGSLTDNGGGLTVSGDITSNGTTLSGTPDITVNNSGAAAVNGSTALSGVGTFTKTGGGTLTVNQDVNAATISLNQGTLLLGASDVLGGSVALAGGSLALASGISETVGTLTLSSSSTISFGGGDESLTFSGASSWTGGTQLTITNYDDSGSADDQLFFTGSLSAAQLSQIKFVNPGGFATGSYDAQIIGGRVTPVNVIPEPSTWIAMILIGFVVAFRERSALGTGLSGLFRRNDKDRT